MRALWASGQQLDARARQIGNGTGDRSLMEMARWCDALTGLMAYDLGATDSGIHDEEVRAELTLHGGSSPRGSQAHRRTG